MSRQVHTLTETVGRSKCSVMAERIYSINPQCDVKVVEDFLTRETCADILHADRGDARVYRQPHILSTLYNINPQCDA
eukprot:2397369-Pyramimonas_sp.AAC.1